MANVSPLAPKELHNVLLAGSAKQSSVDQINYERITVKTAIGMGKDNNNILCLQLRLV